MKRTVVREEREHRIVLTQPRTKQSELLATNFEIQEMVTGQRATVTQIHYVFFSKKRALRQSSNNFKIKVTEKRKNIKK